LLPVSLARDAKRSTFELKVREDDIAANQALQERLRSDFGIALPDLPESSNWLPSSYLNAVAMQLLPSRFAAEAGALTSLMGGALQGKEAAFHLIGEVASTVAKLTAY
jgi:hypothetical protein